MNDDLRELCSRIRQLDQDLDGGSPQLAQLYGGNRERPDNVANAIAVEDSTRGGAWRLAGAIETGSWSDMVRHASDLEQRLS